MRIFDDPSAGGGGEADTADDVQKRNRWRILGCFGC